MRLTDVERRRRLTTRHHLGRAARDGLEAVRGVAAFHSSDPLTPHLGMRARLTGFQTVHLDDLIGRQRTLWRLHAMRGTLFLVPTERAATILAASSLPVARRARERLRGWLSAPMAEGATEWLEHATARVLDVLGRGGEWTTSEITEAVPELALEITVGAGKWATQTPVSSRILSLLAAEGRITRTLPAGSWRSSQYRWAAADRWWDDPPTPIADEEAARAELAHCYLATHGPVTSTDLRWWTGWTARSARAALATIEAVTVDLDSGDTGYVLADDVETGSGDPARDVSFLPGLDPTPMGWKERDWYLGPHYEILFDSNGNAGPTVWAGGRIVGGWGQVPDGSVQYELVEEVDTETATRIDDEARSLSAWLDGEVITFRFRTPLERKLAGGRS